MQRKRSAILILICCLVLYIPLLLLSQDGDMYFTITSGKDLLNGNFNTLSHVRNNPAIIQQWLYAVLLAKFDGFDYIGNIIFVLLQNILLWVISGIFIYNKTNDKNKTILGPIILTLLLKNYIINIRPETITLILIILELLYIDKYKETANMIYLVLVIPILVLSANMHQAIFLYHIYVLIPYYINNKQLDWKLILATPIYILCSLCTPYGVDGSLYIYNTFKSKAFTKCDIIELNPINITSIVGVSIVLFIIIALYLLYTHNTNKYINFYTFMTFILCIISVRHVFLLYIAGIFMVININKFMQSIDTVVVGSACTICLCLSLLMIRYIDYQNGIDIKYMDSLSTCPKILIIIPDKHAKIYNDMNIGGYLEYYGYDNIEIDCRPELYTKEFCGKDIIGNYFNINNGLVINDVGNYELAKSTDTDNALAKYDYVIVKTIPNLYIYRYICTNTKNYDIIFKNDYYIVAKVLLRKDI